MYANKKSVAKAQGAGSTNQNKMNELRHKGMQKGHIQVTKDGKVIQHYRMDSRSAAFMKAFKKAQAEAVQKKEVDEAVGAPEAE